MKIQGGGPSPKQPADVDAGKAKQGGADVYAEFRKALRKELPDYTDAQLEALTFTRVPDAEPGGTSAKFVVEAQVPDKDGKLETKKFTFKPNPDPRHFYARDDFANTLRRAADEPALADGARVHMPINDHQAIEGWVRPRVGSNGRELGNDPKAWTEAEARQVVVDAVWSEFLGNYDMKTDQYAIRDLKKQDTQVAFNKDWDLTLHDYEKSQGELDRYKTYKWKIPTAQNLLFMSYVHGDVNVDFGAMRDAVKRIQGLSDGEVKAALAPFIEAQFKDGASFGQYRTGDELVSAVLARRDALGAQFEEFIGTLEKERGHLTDGKPNLSWGDFKRWLKDERVKVLGWVGNSFILDLYNAHNRHNAEKAPMTVVDWHLSVEK
ncbi:MAG: hypothetical protein K1X89_10155 [Myxococcaceae bacterium]|nr:hypothetical protein [Myxococcaceae bacterium]